MCGIFASGHAHPAGVSAPVIARLEDAGAILVGKTNMDQFATGLAGCRSPYGVPHNPFDPPFIPDQINEAKWLYNSCGGQARRYTIVKF
jgi:Asp-tRNA(Asn)/Glu-tRNA(Gln) amidotransferase A subunit family amidase